MCIHALTVCLCFSDISEKVLNDDLICSANLCLSNIARVGEMGQSGADKVPYKLTIAVFTHNPGSALNSSYGYKWCTA